MIRVIENPERHRAVRRYLARRLIINRDIRRLNWLIWLGQNGHVLDHVLELADIAPPGLRPQEVDRPFGELRRQVARLTVPLPVVGQEMIGEERDILDPLPQWRQLNGN